MKSILTILILLIIVPSIFSQSITKENIENAEKIIGIEYNSAERDSMLSDLDSQLVNYKHLREIDLKNSVPPAILFNPIPVGFEFPKEQKPIKFSDYS